MVKTVTPIFINSLCFSKDESDSYQTILSLMCYLFIYSGVVITIYKSDSVNYDFITFIYRYLIFYWPPPPIRQFFENGFLRWEWDSWRYSSTLSFGMIRSSSLLKSPGRRSLLESHKSFTATPTWFYVFVFWSYVTFIYYPIFGLVYEKLPGPFRKT